MNTSARTAFQVGLLVTVAIALVAALWAFYNGQIRKDRIYNLTLLFTNAQGLAKQDSVLLAGVKIGQVTDVGLSGDGRTAVVKVQIVKHYKIPAGSMFTVSGSLLGGASTVDITPPPSEPPAGAQQAFVQPGSTLRGQATLSFADFQAQAGNLMGQFGKTTQMANGLLREATKTASSVNKMVADPRLRNSLYGTVQNLDLASEQGLAMTRDLRRALASDNQAAQISIANINETTGSIRDAAQENRAQLSQMVSNLNQTTAQLAKLTEQANSTFTRGGTLQNLSDTVANLKDASNKLTSIVGNISQITGDPKVQSDLKETVHNASVASGNARILVERLTALTGGRPTPAGRGNLAFVTHLDFSQNFRTNKFRTDFDLFAPLSNTDFARVGVYDLTGRNELNLQYGQASPYNKLLTYRAGIYASKVGIGADYDLFGDRSLSFDLYDPNRLRLDVRKRIPLNKQGSFFVGLEDVPRTNAITAGLELQR